VTVTLTPSLEQHPTSTRDGVADNDIEMGKRRVCCGDVTLPKS
jgi:hypothetical protein